MPLNEPVVLAAVLAPPSTMVRGLALAVFQGLTAGWCGTFLCMIRASCLFSPQSKRTPSSTRPWIAGSFRLYTGYRGINDFCRHEVWNNTDQERVVLIFDFDRPMRLVGRLINRFLMRGIKRTAYYKEAVRNLKDWDDQLESAVMTSDKLMEEADKA
jgi:Aspartyl/Asparaginyl beta-hydroxylase